MKRVIWPLLCVLALAGFTVAQDYSVIVSNDRTVIYEGIYNVMAYGATGDGDTNDRVAIVAAFAAAGAAGAGEVYFPYGTYQIGAALTMNYDNVRIRGDYATITSDPDSSILYLLSMNSADNVSISGMRFDGADSTNYGVLAYGCDNLRIENCEFFDMGQESDSAYQVAGLYVSNYNATGSDGIIVKNCIFKDIIATETLVSRGIVFGNSGAYDSHVRNITIDGCTFQNIGPVDDADGVVFQMTDGAGDLIMTPIAAKVTNNHFYNCYKRGVKVQNAGVTISGNSFYTDIEGTWEYSDTISDTTWTNTRCAISAYGPFIQISNNNIYGIGSAAYDFGIEVGSGYLGSYGISISNNTIFNDATASGHASADKEPWEEMIAIQVTAEVDSTTYTGDVQISGNYAENVRDFINLKYNVENVNIIGNSHGTLATVGTTGYGFTSYGSAALTYPRNILLEGNDLGPHGSYQYLERSTFGRQYNGSPQGNIMAPKGSISRNSAASGPAAYLKNSGTSTTGWAGISAVHVGATAPTDTAGRRGTLFWYGAGDTLKVYTGASAGWPWEALY